MRKILLTIVFILCGADLYAADKTFTWTNPSANTDGTILDQSTLIDYDLGCTNVSGGAYQVLDSFPAAAPLPTSHTVDLAPGDYWCVLRVSTANASSDWSAPVFFTLLFPIPNTITGVAVD